MVQGWAQGAPDGPWAPDSGGVRKSTTGTTPQYKVAGVFIIYGDLYGKPPFLIGKSSINRPIMMKTSSLSMMKLSQQKVTHNTSCICQGHR